MESYNNNTKQSMSVERQRFFTANTSASHKTSVSTQSNSNSIPTARVQTLCYESVYKRLTTNVSSVNQETTGKLPITRNYLPLGSPLVKTVTSPIPQSAFKTNVSPATTIGSGTSKPVSYIFEKEFPKGRHKVEPIKPTYNISFPSRSLESNRIIPVQSRPAIEPNKITTPKPYVRSEQKRNEIVKPPTQARGEGEREGIFLHGSGLKKEPEKSLFKKISSFLVKKKIFLPGPAVALHGPVLTSSDERYDLKKKAFIQIFNTENFKYKKSKRHGSAKDVQDLKILFNEFNAETSTEIDLNLLGIKSEIHKLTKKDFSSYSCLIITIMTHGDENDILSATDDSYNFRQVILEPLLGNESLLDKPKIFIIQACRGDLACNEVLMETDSVITRSNVNKHSLPTTDIFRCYSSFEGRESYRNPRESSVFIQNFVKVVKQYAKTKSISDIMEVVVKNMSSDNRCAQTPVSTTSLGKKFFFGDLMK